MGNSAVLVAFALARIASQFGIVPYRHDHHHGDYLAGTTNWTDAGQVSA
jgi:hypothetical protein